MRYAIDTNVYAELVRGNARIRALLEAVDEILISTVVLGELHAGFRLGNRKFQNARTLTEFLRTPGVSVVPPNEAVAERYGDLIGTLKENGTPIPTNDVWISATALETASRMLTFDAHYRSVPGLMMVL